MSDRAPMSVDEFDLFVRAIHREFVKDPTCIDVVNDSTFYRGTETKIFFSGGDNIWATIVNKEFVVERPAWFYFKSCKQLNAALALLDIIRSGDPEATTSTEDLICKAIPSARDIIAEKALVGDHGNEAGNSTP